MSGLEIIWLVMGAGLIAYVLTGGADFGGGVWDLLASGPRAAEQRHSVEEALAPIWEANHVWLSFLIVLLFTVYPKAFSAMSIALHIPITLALLGIIMRGAAFVFRSYGHETEGSRARWGRVFAWASALTPVLLGMILAALSSGAIVLDNGHVASGFFAGWTSMFAVALGLFALALFALLAAVYLTVEAPPHLANDFRWRALVTQAAAGPLAFVVFLLGAYKDIPLMRNMLNAGWFWPLQVATAALAMAAIWCLWVRRYRWARAATMSQVGLVVLGWGLGMDKHLILPALEMTRAGTRAETINALLPALGLGALILAPSLWYLFRVFKASSLRFF